MRIKIRIDTKNPIDMFSDSRCLRGVILYIQQENKLLTQINADIKKPFF